MALELVVVACVCNIYCAVAVTQSHMVTRWLAVLAWPFHVDMGLKSRSNSRQGQAGYTTHRISKPYLPYPCQCPNKFGSTFFFHLEMDPPLLNFHTEHLIQASNGSRSMPPRAWPAFGSSSAPPEWNCHCFAPGTSLPSGEAASRGKTWVMVGWLGDLSLVNEEF
jgi:hypothetical protein